MSEKVDVCPVCNLTVAPFEPERVVRSNEVLHGHCARKDTQQVARRNERELRLGALARRRFAIQ